MSTTKPTIVLVPGGWHLPTCYNPIAAPLRELGYPIVPVNLPSVGASPPLKSWDEDVAAIRHAISSAVDQGHEVVLVTHSYSGLPGQEACKGLSKQDQESQGGRGGVIRLVYISAFIGDEGDSLIGFLQNKPLPWFDVDGDTVNPLTPHKIFYNDLSPAQAAHHTSRLLPHSYPTMFSKTTYAAWKDIPSAYLLCEADNAIPLPVQQAMVEGAKAKGGKWVVESTAAGHSPFLSVPEQVVGFLERVAV